jgi:citrate synthase
LYDPGFTNTAVVKSAICYIDGDAGILEYRGYPIEELAEKSNFLEVAYLLIYGELPNKTEYAMWKDKVMKHTFLNNKMSELMNSFNYDAHPMGMFISSMAALSTFHADANPALHGEDLYKDNDKLVNKQIVRIMGKAATIAASSYRHRVGRPFNPPQSDLDYTENFMYMLDRLAETKYASHPKLVRALDIMFILHAEHELNCSTASMLQIGSSRADPYSAVAGAAAGILCASMYRILTVYSTLWSITRRSQSGCPADARRDRRRSQHCRIPCCSEAQRKETDGLWPPCLSKL